MTIVLPENYHIKEELEKNRVECVSQEKALKEDIRALRIGILNVMPVAESYEFRTGELTLSSLRITVTFAVPPRISGP